MFIFNIATVACAAQEDKRSAAIWLSVFTLILTIVAVILSVLVVVTNARILKASAMDLGQSVKSMKGSTQGIPTSKNEIISSILTSALSAAI